MSQRGFGQMYRRLSSKLLDLVVTPHVLGEIPTEPAQHSNATTPDSKKSCAMFCRITRVVMP